ncbi:MAG: nuclear transport factor 2 family protein [Actinomycetota bacterium]
MAHPNEELLRKLDAAFDADDIETAFSYFADDVIAHIGGRSKLAGEYKGREELMGTFGRFMQSMGEDPKLETHDVVAGDQHGFMLQTFTGERGGERVSLKGVGIFHFSNGKISEAWFIDEDAYTADAWYDAGA